MVRGFVQGCFFNMCTLVLSHSCALTKRPFVSSVHREAVKQLSLHREALSTLVSMLTIHISYMWILRMLEKKKQCSHSMEAFRIE